MPSFKFRFAFRSLYRQKLYTILNLAGLAIGLAVAIAVSIYLNTEFNFDKHWPEYDEIYRVNSSFQMNDTIEEFGGSGSGLASIMKDYYPEIEEATHFFALENSVYFRSDSIKGYESELIVADSNFFKVFTCHFLEGDAHNGKPEERGIAISESFAQKYFGNNKVLGKTINTSNFKYKITGVFEDIPENTHHHFNAVIQEPSSVKDSVEMAVSLWQVSRFTFLKIPSIEAAQNIESNFYNFFDRYMAGLAEAVQAKYRIRLQPLASIHFNSNQGFDAIGESLIYVYGFAGIGLLILVLASINYVNMATARSLRRIREAAMRKVLGASERDIQLMILVESIILSLLALLFAFALVEIGTKVLPLTDAIGKDLQLNFRRDAYLWWLPLLLSLVVGISSGLYPALSLSKVSPLDAFSNKKGLQRQNNIPRKLLVGFQVAVSVSVVVIAFFMYQQMDFIKNRSLGFNPDDVILITAQDTSSVMRLEEIRDNIAQSDYVEAVSLTGSVTGRGAYRSIFEIEEEDNKAYRRNALDYLLVSHEYLKTMQIELIQGRSFLAEDEQDSMVSYILVNESMVKFMGWERPIGKHLHTRFNEKGEAQTHGVVIGVTEDFNTRSLHSGVSPLVLLLSNEKSLILHVKVDPKNIYVALDDLERRWTSMVPNAPFQFSFLSRDLLKLYSEEMRQSLLILYLTLIAIFISILGFVGLASFTTGLRTHEIGIRRLLGAGRLQMVNIVFKELLWVMLVGVVIAVPLAIYITKLWLSNFAFQTEIEPWVIISTALFTLLIGYGIVALHSLGITRQNNISSRRQL
jgi:putative ABC transport system permease protein